MAADLILTPAGNCTGSGLPDRDDGRPKLPLMRGCHNQLIVSATTHSNVSCFGGQYLVETPKE